MNLNIYAIYDTAIGCYMRPFFTQSDGEAIRGFTDIALDAEHPIGKHPEDYSLYRIGVYNDQTGKINAEDKQCLCTAHERIAATRNVNQDNVQELDLAIGGTD